jgi:hypothetical protein
MGQQWIIKPSDTSNVAISIKKGVGTREWGIGNKGMRHLDEDTFNCCIYLDFPTPYSTINFFLS